MKGIVWSHLLAVILAAIALAILFYILYKSVPTLSTAVDKIILGIKKPICCDMMGCSAWQKVGVSKLNPVCSTALCWGVCD